VVGPDDVSSGRWVVDQETGRRGSGGPCEPGHVVVLQRDVSLLLLLLYVISTTVVVLLAVALPSPAHHHHQYVTHNTAAIMYTLMTELHRPN